MTGFEPGTSGARMEWALELRPNGAYQLTQLLPLSRSRCMTESFPIRHTSQYTDRTGTVKRKSLRPSHRLGRGQVQSEDPPHIRGCVE
jgi:hypothetical protein